MRKIIWILLTFLGLLLVGYLFWSSASKFDFAMADHVKEAENIRHDFVISDDFDLTKEKLIEVHRDHWSYLTKRNTTLQREAFLLGILMVLMLLFAIREFQRIRHTLPPKP